MKTHPQGRFTPTGVGKPAAAFSSKASRPVHPHRCGETAWNWNGAHSAGGSPPQVWGNRTAAFPSARSLRFTPTGVGKPWRFGNYQVKLKVHPHRCGETCRPSWIIALNTGSPPQVWGNLRLGSRAESWSRFTPTGVGKPMNEPIMVTGPEVHPHRCGETATTYNVLENENGSPPQVWGNRSCQWPAAAMARFTPTGVGKPDMPAVGPPAPAVHPHRCGETFDAEIDGDSASGSPPQVWGNRMVRMNQHGVRRFTPTGVGKPTGSTEISDSLTVHPHRCGETAWSG